MRKRLLFVAYHFPPDPSVASNRTQGLARYLSPNKWDITILTVPHPNRLIENKEHSVIEVDDPGTLIWMRRRFLKSSSDHQSRIGATTPSDFRKRTMARTGWRKWLYELVCYPDPQVNWRTPVVQACSEIVRENGPFDIVLTTSSPETSHLIGRDIKLRGYANRWVADFRDLWTQNHYRKERFSMLRRRLEQLLERRILLDADLLVTVSAPLAELLAKRYSSKRIEVITNGFLPQDHVELEHSALKFTIVYTGQLYAGRRDPEMLFEVVHDMKQRGFCMPGEIQMRFFGGDSTLLTHLIDIYNIAEEVVIGGIISREQALKEQRRATILLVLNWDHPSEKGTFTGKVFEYLDAKRVILALGGPKGVLSDMLETTKAGLHINRKGDMETTLMQWLMEFRQTGQVEYSGISEEVNRFSWPCLAKMYDAILDDLC